MDEDRNYLTRFNLRETLNNPKCLTGIRRPKFIYYIYIFLKRNRRICENPSNKKQKKNIKHMKLE